MAAEYESTIEKVHQQLLDAWNRYNARDFAALFAEDASVVGFDGSMMNGRAEIESTLAAIFKDHTPASYVGKVREVRFLGEDVALLRAVAGMVPPGSSAIKPDVNAVQSLVAVNQDGTWLIALYQNTPAAFHGRPELSEALTSELQALVSQAGGGS